MKTIQTSGKRKNAVARATVRPGTGIIRINKVPVEKLQPELTRMKIEELLIIVNDEKLKTVNIDVKVEGGGTLGQTDAARIALSRAITQFLKKKSVLRAIKDYDRSMLSGDSRQVERKHWGGRKARKRFQKSYR
ncbi:MAG: 30S ribosomal protein S9 [Promethearchaeota archaeon]